MESDVLIDTLQRGRAPKIWTHEGVDLRRRLADVFMAGFERAAARVLEFQTRVAPELHEVLRLVAPGAPMPSVPERRMPEIPTPNVSPLSRFVALDLDGVVVDGVSAEGAPRRRRAGKRSRPSSDPSFSPWSTSWCGRRNGP